MNLHKHLSDPLFTCLVSPPTHGFRPWACAAAATARLSRRSWRRWGSWRRRGRSGRGRSRRRMLSCARRRKTRRGRGWRRASGPLLTSSAPSKPWGPSPSCERRWGRRRSTSRGRVCRLSNTNTSWSQCVWIVLLCIYMLFHSLCHVFIYLWANERWLVFNVKAFFYVF